MRNFGYKTPFTYDHELVLGETNDQPSETVPGQAYSIKEILKRYSNGQSVPIRTRDWNDQSDDEFGLLDEPIRDLTDLDALTQRRDALNKAIKTASERKKAEGKNDDSTTKKPEAKSEEQEE